MPAIVFRPSARFLLSAAAAVIVVAIGATLFTRSHHRDPAPAGMAEARVRDLMLGNEPIERRFDGLFEYFTDGFVRHAEPGYARVRYSGYRSWNGYSVDGLEGFTRTAPLLAAWIYSGRAAGAAGQGGRQLDLLEILRQGILNGVDPRSP